VGTVWQNSDGLKGIDLDGTPGPGGIQQTFDTMIGTQYSVLFDLAGNPVGGPTIKEVEVSAAGVDAIYTFDVTGKSLAAMGWVTKEFKFVATSTSTTLAFRSLTSSGNWGPALDNVRVSAVPTGVVPEPQTYAMMAAGIAALVAFGRRRS
jgi:choice-of-anchor C domain-containing protein